MKSSYGMEMIVYVDKVRDLLGWTAAIAKDTDTKGRVVKQRTSGDSVGSTVKLTIDGVDFEVHCSDGREVSITPF